MNQNDTDTERPTDVASETDDAETMAYTGIDAELAARADAAGDATADSDTDDESDAVPAPVSASASAPTDTDDDGHAEGSVVVRALEQGDFFAWFGLYSEYATFYGEDLTDERAMRAWLWLTGDESSSHGHVAVDSSGELVGLAHVRPFDRLLAGGRGLYLDDLFVAEAARRKGVGRVLLDAVAQEARDGEYQIVRWITAEDNETARRLYEEVASKTPWVTYDITVA